MTTDGSRLRNNKSKKSEIVGRAGGGTLGGGGVDDSSGLGGSSGSRPLVETFTLSALDVDSPALVNASVDLMFAIFLLYFFSVIF